MLPEALIRVSGRTGAIVVVGLTIGLTPDAARGAGPPDPMDLGDGGITW